MKLDLLLHTFEMREIPAIARQAEALGFDALFVAERTTDPNLALIMAAEHTSTLRLGTSVTVALVRSPMVLAYSSWSLAALSQGRFMLGVGSQVRSHLERRYSVPFDSPGPRMRDVILALRTIWNSWQARTPLQFKGRFYSFSPTIDYFTPRPIEHPRIPILLAAVNPYMCRLAGAVADGIHMHPMHTVKNFKGIALPAIDEGLRSSGRTREDLQLVAPVVAVTGASEAEMAAARIVARKQIVMYASTPRYRGLFDIHGLGETADRIRQSGAAGAWEEAISLIDDDMVRTFAVEAPLDKIAEKVREKYDGMADRVVFYEMPRRIEDVGFWRRAIQVFRD